VFAKVDRMLCSACEGNKDDAQEEKLRRIMALPDHLKAKARAIFFAKQRKGDFRQIHESTGGNVCFAFQRGECDRGSECKFVHDSSGTGAAPESASKPAGYWTADQGGEEDVAVQKKSRQETNSAGRPVCFSFQTGSCRRGSACKFAHVLDEAAKAEAEKRGSEKPCYAFQTGSCKRGDACVLFKYLCMLCSCIMSLTTSCWFVVAISLTFWTQR